MTAFPKPFKSATAITIGGLLCIAAITTSGPLTADTIHLKNGKSVSGRIIEQTRTTVKIRWDDGGSQVFQKSGISRIQFSTPVSDPHPDANQKIESDKEADILRNQKADAEQAAARRKELEREQRRRAEGRRKKRLAELQKQRDLAKQIVEREAEISNLQSELQQVQTQLAEADKKMSALQKARQDQKEGQQKQLELAQKNQQRIELLQAEIKQLELKNKTLEQQFTSGRQSNEQERRKQQREYELALRKLEDKHQADLESQRTKLKKMHVDQLIKERAASEKRLKAQFAEQSQNRLQSMSSEQGSALWRSAVLPGWGQAYKDQGWQGVSFMAAWVGLVALNAANKSSLQGASADYNDLTLTYLGLASQNSTLIVLDQILAADKQTAYTSAARQFNLGLLITAAFYIYNLYDAAQMSANSRAAISTAWHPRLGLNVAPEKSTAAASGHPGPVYAAHPQLRVNADISFQW
ncbi:MAG: hypothetical protein KDK39_15900 [Leptospiraceae bacterium]|nr:hypothetical protein [Leptospiraceae bacterium]